jgi:hypothetical protein
MRAAAAVRKAAVRKTAAFLDASFEVFRAPTAAGGAFLMILDSKMNHGVELTGIDSKLTDLIIHVGGVRGGVHNSARNQLIGRSMRLGRPAHSPVYIALL